MVKLSLIVGSESFGFLVSYAAGRMGPELWEDATDISACVYKYCSSNLQGFPGGTVVKNLPAKAEDTRDAGSISGSGKSPWVGTGNPLQYSCLGNSWTEEPGGLQSVGMQRVEHYWIQSCTKSNFHISRSLTKHICKNPFSMQGSTLYRTWELRHSCWCMAKPIQYCKIISL